MSDIETTSVSEQGFVTNNQVGDFSLTIDATDEEGPNPNDVLVADYASCFLPAFRVGGQQRDHDDLGKLQIDAEADLNDEDDVSAIRFDIYVEKDLSDDEAEEITERAEGICHVHAALREELEADISVETDAF
ncbi:OsmC-like protein [Halalkalicoccus paucihalophilus]|jgi:organic hydroperoxide reductase OsmC/OhrA|uniref:OsmC-like protein n=1 Tax=Halalkalicoccus paucihalophilus TaxID=1008153 RepID=A0A151ACG8_9EURY|nr:OsmC family protein [Halalkalicoccus paucihalophilus]KYH25335.1 OsmC-like protein [Halalkalicoccus paucihalophilus]